VPKQFVDDDDISKDVKICEYVYWKWNAGQMSLKGREVKVSRLVENQ